MTNPVLNNNIATDSVILWQYDKAYNLIRLIQAWNEFAKVSCTDFWNYFGNSIFPIDRADTFGLNAWGNMLGIPRPTIYIPKYKDNDKEKGSYDGKINFTTSPKWLEIASSDSEAINKALSEGYIIYKKGSAKTTLYKLVEGFNIDGYSEEGYRVIDDGNVYDEEGEIISDSGWKTVTIQNTLYRGLLKGRFFMMCHSPTVPNYNKYLSIVFGAMDSDGDGKPDYDIFGADGEVVGERASRNIALDFQNMTMGFTFPKTASVEEAYLIFQHYDVVYPFPAGIRYPGEFIDDNLVIGLNVDQAKGQMYKAFVDGLVMADDDSGHFPNGGIFSTTDRANYKVPATIVGKAFICNIATASSTLSITVKANSDAHSARQSVWIDWGNSDCGYRYIPASPNSDKKEIFTTYQDAGLYAVLVLFDSKKVSIEYTFDTVAKYDLSVPKGDVT